MKEMRKVAVDADYGAGDWRIFFKFWRIWA